MSKIENPQNQEIKNMITAMIMATLILFAFNYFAEPKKQQLPTAQIVTETANKQLIAPTVVADEIVYKKADPVTLENEFVKASFDPALGGVNQLSLLKYKETLDENSGNVSLFNQDYYSTVLWRSKDVEMPNKNSFWQHDDEKSTSKKQLFTFKGKDIQIVREVELDDAYMLTIKDTVMNLKNEPIKVYQKGILSRKMENNPAPSTVHQGFVGYLNDELIEEKYAKDEKIFSDKAKEGWFGFTDKYWQSLMVLDNQEPVFVSFGSEGENTYTAEFETDNILVQPNTSVSKTIRLFAGAKDIDVINSYQKTLNIKHFDLSIDFGWFRFLTQPFLHFLNILYDLLGNMGIAILVFATLIRLAVLPIATKSYESMAKMRKVQPKMKAIQDRFKTDPRRLQMEMANLYRREKINPASGCLPLLLQIPVFFALYKVLSISINMRQAPFYGWIQDLSMPDPLTIFNGFGYFDWSVPALLNIGIWPMLMGLTMYVQQKLSPAPADKTQAKVMQFLPVIFTLMMASFASGLIIYWTWSNILSIAQQKYIMKKIGAE